MYGWISNILILDCSSTTGARGGLLSGRLKHLFCCAPHIHAFSFGFCVRSRGLARRQFCLAQEKVFVRRRNAAPFLYKNVVCLSFARKRCDYCSDRKVEMSNDRLVPFWETGEFGVGCVDHLGRVVPCSLNRLPCRSICFATATQYSSQLKLGAVLISGTARSHRHMSMQKQDMSVR